MQRLCIYVHYSPVWGHQQGKFHVAIYVYPHSWDHLKGKVYAARLIPRPYGIV